MCPAIGSGHIDDPDFRAYLSGPAAFQLSLALGGKKVKWISNAFYTVDYRGCSEKPVIFFTRPLSRDGKSLDGEVFIDNAINMMYLAHRRRHFSTASSPFGMLIADNVLDNPLFEKDPDEIRMLWKIAGN